jgi:N-methylhydantoinase B
VALFAANSRTPAARAGDLRAQIAGNVIGERRVLELIERYGAQTFAAASANALRASEVRMREALRALPDGDAEAADVLEDAAGEPTIRLRLRLRKRGDSVELDYRGTSAQLDIPLNAVYGVTLSGVYYVLRALTDPSIPMNEGVFAPIAVSVPHGSLLNPRRPAPVSGGNVETSMRNADLVLSAFAQIAPGRVPAQSGGSMNNVIIGGVDDDGRSWSFYETNGCGMGARPWADGLDAIHAHMTNTLNTPIEAIERDVPLRIVRYEFAAQTAGRGRFRGGCGIARDVALARGSATVSLLADRHTVGPAGLAGGEAGRPGSHHLTRADGTTTPLPAKTSLTMRPGDVVHVQSAGGGGYGDARDRPPEAHDRDRRDGVT